MKSFKEIINEKESLRDKWIETPEYKLKRKLRNDYQYKFYGNKQEITNEVLFMMLMDIMDKLDEIENHILRKEDDLLRNQEDILSNQDNILNKDADDIDQENNFINQ